MLIGYVLGLAFLIIAVRFLWILGVEWVHHRRDPESKRFGLENLRSSAIMTLGGPKGTITLAVAFTIPYTVPQRDLMIFMACGLNFPGYSRISTGIPIFPRS